MAKKTSREQKLPANLGADRQTKAARKLWDATQPWYYLQRKMPLQYVRAFLLVAMYEGKSVQEYADMANVSQTTMSRHLGDIGARNRHMEPGLELVTVSMDPMDQRRHIVALTNKGKMILRDMADAMERE